MENSEFLFWNCKKYLFFLLLVYFSSAINIYRAESCTNQLQKKIMKCDLQTESIFYNLLLVNQEEISIGSFIFKKVKSVVKKI